MSEPAETSGLAATMLQLVSGHWVTQAIRAAALLEIADHLKDGPKHFEDLAKTVDADPRSLYRLLRALSGIGIFQETAEKGVFSTTPLANLLRSDVEGSLKHVAIYQGGSEEYNSCGNIMHSIKTGQPAFDQLHGMNGIDYAMTNPEFLKGFELAMAGYSLADCDAVVAAYDFSSAAKVMDVGGGLGMLLKKILTSNPGLTGVLFDLPPVVESARELLACLEDRCQLVSGSFFNEVPTGADVMILKSVIHDWDDEFAQEILRSCHSALAGGGKLLLCERVIPPGNAPCAGKMMDLAKLIMTPGGQERTEAEYVALLESAGFKLSRTVSTQSAISIMEATKA